MKEEYEVIMVSLDMGSMHDDFVREFGDIIYPPVSYEFKDKLEIARKIIDSVKPDIVYANSIGTHPYAIEARKKNIPTIFHIHELEEGFKWGLMNVNKKYFNNWADKFIAVSDKVKDLLINKMKCDESKIELFNAFVSSEEIIGKVNEISLEDVNLEMGKKDNEKIIVSIGEVGSRKGTDLFIDAHKILKKKGCKFKFVWIGPMRFREQIENSYKNRDKDFLFLGEKSNPYPYLNASDVFVLSSREDPFPLVALESMVLGKPIVAFKESGGMPRVIEGCCGINVKEMNAESLADSIEELYLDREQMDDFGKEGQKIQKENYDSEIIMQKINKLIKTFIENGR
jgi:glycosyltransferase involved in cell wall biosynthesis